MISSPQPLCHSPNALLPGIIQLLPARESLVSDIPAGDGKISDLFLQRRYMLSSDFSLHVNTVTVTVPYIH
jgi:hypothetical protein